MKAAVLSQQAAIDKRPLALSLRPVPEPTAGEILVRVLACAVCRTDLHIVEGDIPARRMPVIPGHQAIGEVAKLGSRTRRFKVGERVGIAWLNSSCGACRFCREGKENLCDD